VVTIRSGSPQDVAINRYLLPNERATLVFRQHPAIVIEPAAIALGSMVAASIVSATGASNKYGAESLVWILAVFLLCRAAYLAGLWSGQYWAITNARLVTVTGFFTRSVTSYELNDLRYCAFERTFGGRLLGYGTIVFNAGRLNRTLIDFLPYPDRIYLEIYGMLSPELAAANSFDDDDGDS